MTFCLVLRLETAVSRFGTGVVLRGSVPHEAVPASGGHGRKAVAVGGGLKKRNKKTGGQNHDVS